jgi:fido (protein-threonine AMPylation protein)
MSPKQGIEIPTVPSDCPQWDYKDSSNYPDSLRKVLEELLVSIRKNPESLRKHASDTRCIHRSLFVQLTEPGFEYYAGQYRGSSCRCLKYYNVEIPSDPRVGMPSTMVPNGMRLFTQSVNYAISQLKIAHDSPGYILSPSRKILLVVVVSCACFDEFLRIHPYADGNGHAARFLIWCLLGQFGYWPERWTIDPRPQDPYVQAITEYRNGKPELLYRRILQCISGSV